MISADLSMDAGAAATLAVVDYGMGNRRSVQKALQHIGARVIVSSDPDVLAGADGLVVPGVGAFPRAMERLHGLGLDALLVAQVAAGRPVLGICLGLQVAFEGSDELGGAEGLGLIPGRVGKLPAGDLRLPHIGWNLVRWERPGPLQEGLLPERAFYHVHSYAPMPAESSDVLATAEYGGRFATAVHRGSFMGVQFHPEKSSQDGLALLSNFASICAGAALASTGMALPP